MLSVTLGVALIGGPLLGLFAYARAARLEAELAALDQRLARLEEPGRAQTAPDDAPRESVPTHGEAATAAAVPPRSSRGSLVAPVAWLLLVVLLGRYVWLGAARVEGPPALLFWLGCYLALSALARERASGAGWLGIVFTWLAMDAWLDAIRTPGQGAARLLMVLAVGGMALAGLLQRTWWRARPAAVTDVLAHLTLAAFLWHGLQRALLGGAAAQRPQGALALAFVYLSLAVTARGGRGADRMLGHTLFGVAAAFASLASASWFGLAGGLAVVVVLGLGLLGWAGWRRARRARDLGPPSSADAASTSGEAAPKGE